MRIVKKITDIAPRGSKRYFSLGEKFSSLQKNNDVTHILRIFEYKSRDLPFRLRNTDKIVIYD